MNHLENVGYKEWRSVLFFSKWLLTLLLPQTFDFVCFTIYIRFHSFHILNSMMNVFIFELSILFHCSNQFSQTKYFLMNTWKSFISLAVPFIYCYSINHYKASWLKTIACWSHNSEGCQPGRSFFWSCLGPLTWLQPSDSSAGVDSPDGSTHISGSWCWLSPGTPWFSTHGFSSPVRFLGFLTSWYLNSKKASPQTQALIKPLTPPLPQTHTN